jgi:hypothetical protein
MIIYHIPAVAEAMARRAHADQPPREATARQADTDVIPLLREKHAHIEFPEGLNPFALPSPAPLNLQTPFNRGRQSKKSVPVPP